MTEFRKWTNKQEHDLSPKAAPSLLDYVQKGSASIVGVVTLFGMIVTCVLWVGKLNSGILDLQAANAVLVNRLDRNDEIRSLGFQRLAKVEEGVSRIDETLTRMEAKIDRALDRSR